MALSLSFKVLIFDISDKYWILYFPINSAFKTNLERFKIYFDLNIYNRLRKKKDK